VIFIGRSREWSAEEREAEKILEMRRISDQIRERTSIQRDRKRKKNRKNI